MRNTVHDTFIGKTFMRWLALIIFCLFLRADEFEQSLF